MSDTNKELREHTFRNGYSLNNALRRRCYIQRFSTKILLNLSSSTGLAPILAGTASLGCASRVRTIMRIPFWWALHPKVSNQN